MATIFPKKRLRSSEVIDAEDVNKNVREILREAESNLGEHNWKEDAFTIDDLEVGAVIEVTTHSFAVSTEGTLNGATCAFHGPLGNNSAFTIGDSVFAWVTIGPTDPLHTFPAAQVQTSTGNSLVWVIFSAQTVEWPTVSGMEFAIAMDGQIIPETITGSTDRSNEPGPQGFGFGDYNAIACEALIPCGAGSHTFEAKLRTRLSGTTHSWTGVPPICITNYELIVIEMK